MKFGAEMPASGLKNHLPEVPEKTGFMLRTTLTPPGRSCWLQTEANIIT